MKERRTHFEETLPVIWTGGLHPLESVKWRRRVIELAGLAVLFAGWDDEIVSDLETLMAVARVHARWAAEREAALEELLFDVGGEG